MRRFTPWKKLTCRDMGVDCDFSVCGKTEDEILEKAKADAKKA
jgi:predicted small metal-binding protein